MDTKLQFSADAFHERTTRCLELIVKHHPSWLIVQYKDTLADGEFTESLKAVIYETNDSAKGASVLGLMLNLLRMEALNTIDVTELARLLSQIEPEDKHSKIAIASVNLSLIITCFRSQVAKHGTNNAYTVFAGKLENVSSVDDDSVENLLRMIESVITGDENEHK